MELLILPLLIATNHMKNNEIWKNGPEITYNMTFNTEINFPQLTSADLPSTISSNFSAQIKCQYEDAQYLHCHLKKPVTKFGSVYGTNTTISTWVVHPELDSIYKIMVFEIKFNKFGIEDLIVSSTVPPFLLDELKSIVYPFHAGINLKDKVMENYEFVDKFITGDCSTNYQIKSDGNETNKQWHRGMSIAIEKTRNLEKCTATSKYHLASGRMWIDDSSSLTIDIKSSKSKIIANNSTFISSIETVSDLYGLKGSQKSPIMHLYENVTITYDSVMPAKNKFVPIEDPKSIGIIIGQDNDV